MDPKYTKPESPELQRLADAVRHRYPHTIDRLARINQDANVGKNNTGELMQALVHALECDHKISNDKATEAIHLAINDWHSEHQQRNRKL